MAARRRGKVARKIYWRSFSLFETSIHVVNAITMLFNGKPERETSKLCLFESHNELIFGRVEICIEIPGRLENCRNMPCFAVGGCKLTIICDVKLRNI